MFNCEKNGVKIDGEFLNNIRFAGEIIILHINTTITTTSLQELSDESRRMYLNINIAKTNVMVADNTPINGNNVLIETVEGYVHFGRGQPYSLEEKNQDKEMVTQRDTTKNHGIAGRYRPNTGISSTSILSYA